jgi:hypothetical protein
MLPAKSRPAGVPADWDLTLFNETKKSQGQDFKGQTTEFQSRLRLFASSVGAKS